MNHLKTVLLSCLLVGLAPHPQSSTASASMIAQVESIDSRTIPYDVWHKSVMPGEKVEIQTQESFIAEIDGVSVDGYWTAPEASGHSILKFYDAAGSLHKTITIFILEPSSNIDSKGYLGTYRIGKYPKNTPRGFIKLSKGDGDLAVSPSFNVGQFLCKQQINTWPKFLLVSEDNLARLETLLGELNEDGLTNADTLFVMSGYRTPFYNAAIGSAKFSRHMYGDAADVYVDVFPRDGVMDDLNSDGEITKADANYLYDYAQDLFTEKEVEIGGLGSYKANAVHGPFIHVDARGYKARWGR